MIFDIKKTPLPKDGTCSHYNNSRRWFRFPCCARVFPCDQCHQQEFLGKHELIWANRMICGSCSAEQVFSSSCRKCGFQFNKTSKTHWEGGKGQRDTTKLSKGDKRKYSGMSKTISKKKQTQFKLPKKNG